MARNTDSPRRLKGYYGFSKKYPSRRGERPIHESRRTKKRERTKLILFCVALCCLFVSTFIVVKVCYNLSTRPLPNENSTESPSVVTVDSLNSLRAIYLENSILDDTADFDAALKSAAENGFNAIMLDFKTQEGVLTYNSKLISYNGDTQYNEINQTIINKIKSEGFIIVARIFCFEDSVAPQRLNAYVYEDVEKTKIWLDDSAINNGKVWLDPTNSKATSYLNKVVAEVVKTGADCIYLDSVQFPVSRDGAIPVYTQDDTTLNRSLVLMEFLGNVVDSAKGRPVILGTPFEGIETGDTEKWGGTLFDTPAHMCSPTLQQPSTGDFVSFIENNYIVLNGKAANNFSTMKIVPTVKIQAENTDFYKKLSSSKAESYIIIP